MPVDHFLTSLAEDQKGRAVGVILSGTAADGTLGLKAIKAEGGITFAQDEQSAKYHGMPSSAIAAGCVDFVLSPDRIGKELGRLARHPYIGVSHLEKVAEQLPVGEDDFRKILSLLRTGCGVDFTYYKPGTIRRRIARRMVLHKIESMKNYLAHLQTHRPELEGLFQDILIHVTSFFREPEVFKILQGRVFPAILSVKKRNEPIRVWVPGCSTGEEVYSLAIALLEFLGERATSVPIQVFGTDISDLAIEKARSGTYTESSIQEVTPARLRRFFSRTDAGYQINKTIREMCIFARQDLTRDPPFSRIDLISCRNVLIYLGALLQKRVIASFHYGLAEHGFLLLGKSETLTAYQDLFTIAEKKARVYTKRPSSTAPAIEFSAVVYEKAEPPPPPPEETPVFDALKEADRVVWLRYSHSGLVLNDNLEILHFRGDTSPYLAPASGKASLNVLRMVREELKMELRSAIHKARKENAPTRRTGIHLKRNGHDYELNVEVIPIAGPGSRMRYLLVLFDDLRAAAPEPPASKAPRRLRAEPESAEVIRLRQELTASREYLQSIVEQQEATNEELKSANEEILSSNEELQSTNEELETAKEELQSTNEELVTLNETLQSRNAELAQLSDDLSNVLSGTNIPVLIVGDEGRIRRFTPAAERLLNLLPGDVGRPISNIRPNIEVPDLDERIREVCQTLVDIEREVKDREGHWWSMRVRPYLTSDKKIDGVLIAFVDIHAFKENIQALHDRDATLQTLMESCGEAILSVSRDGRILLTNVTAERMFGYGRKELVGRPVEMLVPERFRGLHTAHRAGYFGEPRNRPMGTGIDLLARRKDGAEFPVEISLSYIETTGGLTAVALVADITERKAVERTLAESAAALRASEERLRVLTASLISSQEEERERVARELHDDLNQRLAALAMQAHGLAEGPPESAAGLRGELAALAETIGALSDDVRRLAHELHPAMLQQFGLSAALSSYCQEFTRREAIKVRYQERGECPPLADEVALALYRIAVECLRNVARHSTAKSATVVLASQNGAVHLMVSDRGAGFDPSLHKPGLGLIGMRERARLAGGTLSIHSREGSGVRVEVRIPQGGR